MLILIDSSLPPNLSTHDPSEDDYAQVNKTPANDKRSLTTHLAIPVPLHTRKHMTLASMQHQPHPSPSFMAMFLWMAKNNYHPLTSTQPQLLCFVYQVWVFYTH